MTDTDQKLTQLAKDYEQGRELAVNRQERNYQYARLVLLDILPDNFSELLKKGESNIIINYANHTTPNEIIKGRALGRFYNHLRKANFPITFIDDRQVTLECTKFMQTNGLPYVSKALIDINYTDGSKETWIRDNRAIVKSITLQLTINYELESDSSDNLIQELGIPADYQKYLED